MRFLIIPDLHGQIPRIYFNDFDAILAVGDFCSDKIRSIMFKEVEFRMKNPSSTRRWYDLIKKDKAKLMVEKSLEDGRRVLEKLNSYNVPVYIVPGNWDWTKDKSASWEFLQRDNFGRIKKGLENIVDINNRSIRIGGIRIVGYGGSSGPEYPQYKEELARFNNKQLIAKKKDYDKKFEVIAKIFEKANEPIIFLTHNVPYMTPLDMITNKESPRFGYHHGSLIAKEMVKQYYPIICIGGHMHEHFGKCKVGKTVVINAGYGGKKNILLDVKDGKITKLDFIDHS